VAHCGTDIEGGYLYTLTLTDVTTGWTECLPLLYRSQETVLAAIQRARTLFPFPILGIDTAWLGNAQARQLTELYRALRMSRQLLPALNEVVVERTRRGKSALRL